MIHYFGLTWIQSTLIGIALWWPVFLTLCYLMLAVKRARLKRRVRRQLDNQPAARKFLDL